MGRVIFPLVLFLFTLVIIVYARNYRMEARLFPWVIGFSTLLALAIYMWTEINTNLIQKTKKKTGEIGEEKTASGWGLSNIYSRWGIALWIISFVIVIFLTGLLPATFLLVLLYSRFGGTSWKLSFAFASITLILVYGIFTIGLKMNLYSGVFL